MNFIDGSLRNGRVRRRSSRSWTSCFPKKIPCAPIYTVKEVVEDDHIARARRMIRDIEHPIAGPVKVIASFVNMSETSAEVASPAPLLGQHSEEVLKDVLNFTQEETKSLI